MTGNTKSILLKFSLTLDSFSRLNLSDINIDGENKNIITLLTGEANVLVNINAITLVGGARLIKPNDRLAEGKAMITLSNMVFIGSTVMFDLENTNDIFIKNVIFFLGPVRNTLTFCSIISHIYMQNVTTLNGSNTCIPSLSCSKMDLQRSCDLAISLSRVSANGLEDNRHLTIIISNSALRRPFGAGICIPSIPGDRV